MTVEESLGLLVTNRDGIIVVDGYGIGSQHIIRKCLLELGCHEVITGTRTCEDSKVDLEPEQIEQEGQYNQAYRAGCEMISELRESQRTANSLDVQKIPKINNHCGADGYESEQTDIFSGDIT
ncbi:hypothetical protein RRF57_000070 [Xylaria bambusicola]|uniref:Uncharacterized protein n=1 Tax=Xylaria bambusicola TaxID=326684 RepID=A0AAN7U371_9PEZI